MAADPERIMSNQNLCCKLFRSLFCQMIARAICSFSFPGFVVNLAALTNRVFFRLIFLKPEHLLSIQLYSSLKNNLLNYTFLSLLINSQAVPPTSRIFFRHFKTNKYQLKHRLGEAQRTFPTHPRPRPISYRKAKRSTKGHSALTVWAILIPIICFVNKQNEN